MNGTTIGIPNVKPETSRRYTLRAIVEPTRWFNVSVDYYHISKSHVIGGPNQGNILAAYFAGQPLPAGVTITPDAPDPLYPNALPRPLVIHEPYVNTNSEETDGINMRAEFTVPYDVLWTSDFNFTDIFSFNYEDDGTTYSYVGAQAPCELSSGGGTPKSRANWAGGFTYERFNVTGTVYYVGSIKETGVDATGSTTACLYPGLPSGFNVTPYWDFDMTLRYEITDRILVHAISMTCSTPSRLSIRPTMPADPTAWAPTTTRPTPRPRPSAERSSSVST